MKEDTFTYTARSSVDPSKVATFTLYNGSVSVDLGSALVEQVEESYPKVTSATVDDDTSEKDLTAWIKPAAVGALQKLIKPVQLTDFDAEKSGDALQATAWIRTGGLRLAPIMMNWEEVDNPAGAQAFVTEVRNRKESTQLERGHPAPLDYWASWIAIGLMALALPILFLRQWQQRRS